MIGGFASVEWASLGGFVKDDKAFLFSINYEQKYTVKDSEKAIYHDSGRMCAFGEKNGLFVYDNPQGNK